jgi:FixJ family two-component response regulator
MMPQLTETLEHAARPHCSREQARELLEALRTAYQSLSLSERSVVKSMIGRAQREQLLQEIDEERECFESVS